MFEVTDYLIIRTHRFTAEEYIEIVDLIKQILRRTDENRIIEEANMIDIFDNFKTL